MPATVKPILMFQGQASEAIAFYTSLFSDAEVLDLVRYGADVPGREGTVKTAKFTIGGQILLCLDSPAVHDFTFTPSFSLWVDCESEEQIDTLAAALTEGGKVFMPLGDYGFSRKFAWVADRFGVSWQINLAKG